MVAALIFFSPGLCSSQRLGIAYDDYLRAIGMEDDYIVMKNILKNELMARIKDRPDVYYNDNAGFFSMVLLLSGVTPKDYYTLQQNGVDVIHAITADVRPFDEQSLLADVAVTGRVIEVLSETHDDDGFDITLKIEISELLKGGIPGDTLQIRQRSSSRLPGSDTRPELNESYLFLLSSGMYGYHKANHQLGKEKEIVVVPPAFGEMDTFLIYRLYPYKNGKLFRSTQNTEAAFNSLKTVNYLLRKN